MSFKRQDKTFKKRLALKADRIRMTRAITNEIRYWDWAYLPEDINNGSCFDFATVVFELIAGCKIAGQNIGGVGHTWIEYKGRCYDAEVPEGVRNWLSLPFWKRLQEEMGIKEFNKALKKATQ